MSNVICYINDGLLFIRAIMCGSRNYPQINPHPGVQGNAKGMGSRNQRAFKVKEPIIGSLTLNAL